MKRINRKQALSIVAAIAAIFGTIAVIVPRHTIVGSLAARTSAAACQAGVQTACGNECNTDAQCTDASCVGGYCL